MDACVTATVQRVFHLKPRSVGILAVALILSLACLGFGQTNAEYRLGPEDAIHVNIMDHSELSGEFTVLSDGTISLPRAGQLSVSGKTLAETANLIVANLAKSLRDPEVSVTLRTPRQQLIYVMGAIQKPGPCALKPGWRTTEAIGAAGGLQNGVQPTECTVSILHCMNGKRESIPYQDLFRGDTVRNPELHTGDVVTVESVETIPVYVMGKVNRPGLYNLRVDSAGVLEAITMAGGHQDDAALSKVTVTHLDGKSETVNILPVTTEGKQTSLLRLRAGDMLVVPDSFAKFAVLGWVNAPGFFQLKENEHISLSEAIGMAHGIENKRGGLKKVAVLRVVDGKEQRQVYDLSKFAKKGDSSQNPEILPGDVVWVPETSGLDWDRALSGLSTGLSLVWSASGFGR